MSDIRVRFAPSPTGYLHVGGLRTALYNYLFARHHHGRVILRIEDTDRTRYVEGAEENLIKSLEWAGIGFDEGPVSGGASGPYRQSERLELYKTHALQLVEEGKAYYAFDTAEELEEMRKTQEKSGASPKYDRRALRLSSDEVKAKLDAGIPYVVRLRIPDGTVIAFDDLVRGRVEFNSDLIDDQVLLKSDGYPTYHLANVVDDHLMKISHVIRGEEWLPSTPKHVVLYQCFGWDAPQFAHLPLLLNPDKSKLSKRQGDVAVEDYRAKGYLNEALVNFVAFLGWNPGDERELLSMEELTHEFSLDRVGKSGAVFNLEKLNWLNEQYLRRKSDEELLVMVKDELSRSRFAGRVFDDAYLLLVVNAMRERVSFPADFVEKSPYFFEAPSTFDQAVVQKRWKANAPQLLTRFMEEVQLMANSSKEAFEAALHRAAETAAVKPAEVIHPLRLAVSGVGAGPGLYDILHALGKEEVTSRIRTAIDILK